MKANELMIGDWVLIDEPDKFAGCVGRITSLRFHQSDDGFYPMVYIAGGKGYLEVEVFNEDLRPIPLTPEILEKNLATCQQIAWYIGFNKPTDIHVEIKTDSNCFYGVVDYVHQLQHVLKLCGIEKDIVL